MASCRLSSSVAWLIWVENTRVLASTTSRLVLANAVTLLNPAALLLGGTVLKGCPTLRQRSELVLKEQVLAVAGENLKILEPALGDDGGIVGAALLALPGEPIG